MYVCFCVRMRVSCMCVFACRIRSQYTVLSTHTNYMEYEYNVKYWWVHSNIFIYTGYATSTSDAILFFVLAVWDMRGCCCRSYYNTRILCMVVTHTHSHAGWLFGCWWFRRAAHHHLHHPFGKNEYVWKIISKWRNFAAHTEQRQLIRWNTGNSNSNRAIIYTHAHIHIHIHIHHDAFWDSVYEYKMQYDEKIAFVYEYVLGRVCVCVLDEQRRNLPLSLIDE